MKFRHPQGIRLALLSGHVTNIGPDWVDLDQRFHQAAFAAGCHCDQGVIGDRPNVPDTRNDAASTDIDEPAKIRQAIITMLERSEEGDFTAAGNPHLNVVSGLCGFRADKETTLRVWHELQAEAKPETVE